MEHFIPIIVFVVFALVKVLKAVGNLQGDEDGPAAPRGDSELERARRFREALGLPPDAAAPGPVRRRKPAMPATTGKMPTVIPPAVLIPGRLKRVRPDGQPTVVIQVPPLILPAPPRVVSTPDFSPPPPLPMPVKAEVPMESAARKRAMAAMELAYRQEPVGSKRNKARARGILGQLRVHGSARNAMILREVLGKPKAFG